MDSTISGGFNYERDPVRLEDAIINAEKNHSVDENGKVFLEAERAATAANVTGERGQILERDGFDFLVAAYFCGSLQIHFEVAGHYANEVADFVAMDENCLENLIDVFA